MSATLTDPEPCEPPTAARKAMTLTDVVKLSQRGIAEDIIVRHMEQTNTTFELTVEASWR